MLEAINNILLSGTMTLITAGASSLNSFTTMDKNKGKKIEENRPTPENRNALPVIIPRKKSVMDDKMQIRNVLIYPNFSATIPPSNLPRANRMKYRAR